MCGIIAAVARRDIVGILLAGLARLEYRGYDSAGLAVVDRLGSLQRVRRTGKVQVLSDAVKRSGLQGSYGLAHTRWATHGAPSEVNAHPHICEHVIVVHNGIIENHQVLRSLLQQRGYHFSSESDSEIIAHLVHWEQAQWQASQDTTPDDNTLRDHGLRIAVQRASRQLQGSYGMVIMDSRDPTRLVAVRCGSSLVIGCGQDEQFIASDPLALLPVTRQMIILQEGEVAEITPQQVTLFDSNGKRVERPAVLSTIEAGDSDKGHYRHYMRKEIDEQPRAIKHTLEGRILGDRVDLREIDEVTGWSLQQVQHLKIVACGTAYHAGMVARYWFESLIGIPCDVDIASEFIYRQPTTRQNSLLLLLSQSGETADTLAALRLAKDHGYLGTLAICNNAGSSLAREADGCLLTRAGREISVASTKAFTTQLVLLLLLVAKLGHAQGTMSQQQEQHIVEALKTLPQLLEQLLSIDTDISVIAAQLVEKTAVLFVGRGEHYPIAMEGALKLKEISYLFSEAYAAGELKHGPLALMGAHLPVVVLAPHNRLSKKLGSNIEEMRARGGQLYLFADHAFELANSDQLTMVRLPPVAAVVSPILYSIPLQLLAYHVALLKETDIDQPRNLAKSVTVE